MIKKLMNNPINYINIILRIISNIPIHNIVYPCSSSKIIPNNIVEIENGYTIAIGA